MIRGITTLYDRRTVCGHLPYILTILPTSGKWFSVKPSQPADIPRLYSCVEPIPEDGEYRRFSVPVLSPVRLSTFFQQRRIFGVDLAANDAHAPSLEVRALNVPSLRDIDPRAYVGIPKIGRLIPSQRVTGNNDRSMRVSGDSQAVWNAMHPGFVPGRINVGFRAMCKRNWAEVPPNARPILSNDVPISHLVPKPPARWTPVLPIHNITLRLLQPPRFADVCFVVPVKPDALLDKRESVQNTRMVASRTVLVNDRPRVLIVPARPSLTVVPIPQVH